MADRQSSLVRLAALFSVMMQRSAPRSLSHSLGPVRIGVAAGGAPVVFAEEGPEAETGSEGNVENATGAHAGPEEPARPEEKLEAPKTVVRSLGEQLSIGGVLGFATGYSIRKIGKAVMFVVGTEVCILQYMAYRQWLVMDWRKLANDMAPKFDKSVWDGALQILVYKMPFNVAFTGGLMAGLRLTAPK